MTSSGTSITSASPSSSSRRSAATPTAGAGTASGPPWQSTRQTMPVFSGAMTMSIWSPSHLRPPCGPRRNGVRRRERHRGRIRSSYRLYLTAQIHIPTKAYSLTQCTTPHLFPLGLIPTRTCITTLTRDPLSYPLSIPPLTPALSISTYLYLPMHVDVPVLVLAGYNTHTHKDTHTQRHGHVLLPQRKYESFNSDMDRFIIFVFSFLFAGTRLTERRGSTK